MTSKKWFILFISITFVFLTAFACVMYWLDPLFHYGHNFSPLTYYEFEDLYSNPGIAMHYEYDTVLVGTSMIENTLVAECNEAFDCDMIRLSYSGGTTCNFKSILDVCFNSGNNIKTVYWELNDYQLRTPYNKPRFPIPEYLYSYDHTKDLSYLLNLDIFYKFAISNLRATADGAIQPPAPYGETFGGDFSKEGALRTYDRPNQAAAFLDQDAYLESAKLNLEHNILPLIQANPDTEFVFFFVPFSMLYWDNEIRAGTLDATLASMEYAIETLLTQENVRVYFYADHWDIATNLDNYKDYSHYGIWINSHITQLIAAGEDRMTPENYSSVLADMKQFLYSYDYEPIFQK